MDLADQLHPGCGGPRLVVNVQSPPASAAATHAAIVTRLHQYQRASWRPSPRGNPRVQLLPLRIQHPEARCRYARRLRQWVARCRQRCGGLRAKAYETVNPMLVAVGGHVGDEQTPRRIDPAPREHSPDARQLTRVTLANVDGARSAAVQDPKHPPPGQAEHEGDVPGKRPDLRHVRMTPIDAQVPGTGSQDHTGFAVAVPQAMQHGSQHDHVAEPAKAHHDRAQGRRRGGSGALVRAEAHDLEGVYHFRGSRIRLLASHSARSEGRDLQQASRHVSAASHRSRGSSRRGKMLKFTANSLESRSPIHAGKNGCSARGGCGAGCISDRRGRRAPAVVQRLHGRPACAVRRGTVPLGGGDSRRRQAAHLR